MGIFFPDAVLILSCVHVVLGAEFVCAEGCAAGISYERYIGFSLHNWFAILFDAYLTSLTTGLDTFILILPLSLIL